MVSTLTQVNPEVLPSSHPGRGASVFSWKSKTCCTAKAAEIHWGIQADWNKKNFDFPPTQNKSSCLQGQREWCNHCPETACFYHLCDIRRAGNKVPGNIIPRRLQTGHLSSLLGERTNTVNRAHQRLSGASNTTSTQAQVQSLLNREEMSVRKSGARRSEVAWGFRSEPNPHSALKPSNIRQKPANHRQNSSKF